jgi:hypothetical protein
MKDAIGEFLFYVAIGSLVMIVMCAVGDAIGRVFRKSEPDEED